MRSSMVNLLRASNLAFPGETVMEDAKAFSSAYLKQVLEKSGDINDKSFLKEVGSKFIILNLSYRLHKNKSKH